MRFTSLLLLGGMLFAPIGSILIGTAHAQDDGGRQGPGRGGRGGPGGRMMGGMASLLAMEEVQKELKLEDSQKQSLKDAREQLSAGGPGGFGGGPGGPGGPGGGGGRGPGGPGGPGGGGFTPPSAEMMEEMATRMQKVRHDLEEKITDILDPDQTNRLLGLLIQREGGRALMSEPLSNALELSPDQLTKLAAVQKQNREDSTKARQEAMAAGGGGGGGGGGWMQMREQMEVLNKKAGDALLAVLTPDQAAKFEAMKGTKFDFPANEGRGGGGPNGGGGPRRDRPAN